MEGEITMAHKITNDCIALRRLPKRLSLRSYFGRRRQIRNCCRPFVLIAALARRSVPVGAIEEA